VLPVGKGIDLSTRTSSGGSMAVLYQNELHDWRSGSQANAHLARLGILYGKSRLGFVVEPLGGLVTPDFARAHVLVGGRPTFETEAWLMWAEQFRQDTPEAITAAMVEEQERLHAEDPDQAKRIRERLKDVMQLLRPRRFRVTPSGQDRARPSELTGGDGAYPGDTSDPNPNPTPRPPAPPTPPGPQRPRGIGSSLSDLDEAGEAAEEATAIMRLTPRWVTEAEASDMVLVNGNGKGIHDRAAALAGVDARTAGVLLMNREFRGFQTILAAVNEWANPEGDELKAKVIDDATREWIDQKMIEAVNGLRQLENGSTWLTEHYDDALSPVALTAVFMADRYHTLAAVKRQVGSIRQSSPTAAAS
jgi:hypothetical protein